ncbi:MAG TPA: NAD(P)H-dependent glycerol-3-phosphate dehydrogenase [Pseudolabrys sp.]|nr:NAD(P)H-dependent glycerol-3-phosphate dehydrogenase [Pseudolabrys sp.]
MSRYHRIGILGAGAFGTALANAAVRAGRAVKLYDNDVAVLADIKKNRMNSIRLPGIPVEAAVEITESLSQAAAQDALLLIVPTQDFRTLVTALAKHAKPGTPLVACAKGIERGSGKFVTEIILELIPHALTAILSGPSFASDVAKGLPAAVTLASDDKKLAVALAEALSSPTFRVYHSTDVRGVEIGGAAKNVLAIAGGIVAGRNMGASAQAALITRGFAELARFGRAYGAKPDTLMGLSGLGDLILTGSTPQSRNFTLGFAIGRGEKPAVSDGPLAEGAFTAPVLVELARKKGVDMPIAETVDALLAGRVGIEEAIARLLARPLKAEA